MNKGIETFIRAVNDTEDLKSGVAAVRKLGARLCSATDEEIIGMFLSGPKPILAGDIDCGNGRYRLAFSVRKIGHKK